MDEIFEELLKVCMCQDVDTIGAACKILGVNCIKIFDYAATDSDARDLLRICCGSCKCRVLEKYYLGSMSKNDADLLIGELDILLEIYLKVPIDTSEGA